MDNNMMADYFIPESEYEGTRVPITGRDENHCRLSRISNAESFISTSLNHENFGDWGSFSTSRDSKSLSTNDLDIYDPFLEQKDEEDGFNIIERHTTHATPTPKPLPVSRREIRKRFPQHHCQPTVVIEAGPSQGENDFMMSPMGFKSPVSSMSKYKKIGSEPTRNIKRSVSDVGSFQPKFDDDPFEDNEPYEEPPSPSFRNLLKKNQGTEMSLSFSHRRRPFSNRALLSQIGEKRESYRNLYAEMDDDYDPKQPSDDDEENFEGSMPLKTTPEPTTVKKRSTSKSRLNLRSGAEDLNNVEVGIRPPTRKNSYGSRSSSASSRRLKTRKASLSDSNSNRSRRKSRERNGDQHSTGSNGKNRFSTEKRDTMLAEVRRQRSAGRLSEKGTRNVGRSRSGSRRNLTGGKKKKEIEVHSEELHKHASRCNHRRTVGRRASMTGGIVDTEKEHPKERTQRRSTMDHIKSPHSTASSHRPRDSRRRRATMDHYRNKSPSKSRSSHNAADEERNPVSPCSDDSSTSTTQSSNDGSYSYDDISPPTLSRKSSVGSRERQLPRKTKSGDMIGSSNKQQSHNLRRKTARTRSDLGRHRQRSGKHLQQPEEEQDKSVTVAEILALVAITPSPNEGYKTPSNKSKRSRSKDPIETSGSSRSGTHTTCSHSTGRSRARSRSRSSEGNSPRGKSREKVRGRSNEGSRHKAREKSRSRSRQRMTPKMTSSFSKLRKGKRVDHHSQEGSEHSPKKKEKTSGKECRRGLWSGRRGSAL